MALAITVAVIAALVALAVTLRRSASRGKRPPAAGPAKGGWPPPLPHQDEPGFTVVDNPPGGRADHGFNVLHAATDRRPAASPRGGRTARGGPPPGAAGFAFVVSGNPTAICKLTGRQVRDCACDKHRGRDRR
jgi:hypothetical protein